MVWVPQAFSTSCEDPDSPQELRPGQPQGSLRSKGQRPTKAISTSLGCTAQALLSKGINGAARMPASKWK